VIGWTQTLTVNLLAGDDSFLDFSPGAHNRVLGGDGADILQPLAGNDTLEGQNGDDVLWAGDGNDSLIGGLGADNLLGGAGNDRFVYASTADSTPLSFDVIGDFAAGDRIDLAQIDANTAGGTSNDAFTVVSAFDSTPGRLVLTNGGGFFVVQGDVNGDNVADFTLVVVATSLTAADFVL
jgi:Ca2+-binding RTX toxin-like protein